MWRSNSKTDKTAFQYVKKSSADRLSNRALEHASAIMRSEMNLANSALQEDFKLIMNNGCTYLSEFFCRKNDLRIFNKLQQELKNNETIKWSQHSKIEDPDCSETFKDIIKKMSDHFGVTVLQTRLNYYPDENSYKPMHKDRHAYGEGENKIREDFTMGASFGCSRNLDFQHEESGSTFTFPQNNGDVFAFNADINKKFLHGVPKTLKKTGPRFSIIAWGIKNDEVKQETKSMLNV